MDKRELHWKHNRNLIVVMISITAAVIILAIGSYSWKEWKQKQKQEAARQQKIEEQERVEQERLDTIETALTESAYGDELRTLYETYPQIETILLNMQDYPDWLLEHMIAQPETIDWVVEYPEYMKKSEEEINQIALEPVDLEQYEIHGQIPIFYQWTSTWGYAKYGEEQIAIDGCGPTCLAMVAVGLTGDTSYTPKKVADISMEIGTYLSDTGTTWDLMEKGPGQMGFQSWQMKSWSASAILQELESGHPVICSMKEGNFTTQGHFIVLAGVAEDGKVLVNDPNSKVRTQTEWDAQELLDQAKGMWAFSK